MTHIRVFCNNIQMERRLFCSLTVSTQSSAWQSWPGWKEKPLTLIQSIMYLSFCHFSKNKRVNTVVDLYISLHTESCTESLLYCCFMDNKVLTVEWRHDWKNPVWEEVDAADFQSDEGPSDVEVDRWTEYLQLTNCCRTNLKPVRIKFNHFRLK